ncbi:MAG: hypothetical protein WKF60_00905 [Ilumatobacter sp.]
MLMYDQMVGARDVNRSTEASSVARRAELLSVEQLPFFDRLLWDADSPVGLVDFVMGAHRSAAHQSVPGGQLTFWTLLSPDSEALTDRLVMSGGASVLSRRTSSVSHALLIEFPRKDPFVLAVWAAETSGVVHVLSSVPVSDGRWKRVERWISNTTAGAKVFLSDGDFLRIGDRMAEIGGLGVSKLTARAGDGSSLNRGFPSRRQPSLLEAVGMVDRNSQLRTVLRRLAGATFYSGDFSVFYDCVLREIEAAATRQRTLYSGRTRHANVPVAPPVSITVPDGFFGNREKSGEFISSLSSISHLAVATVHRNPYLHLAVSDYTDGSTFDVFVTSDEEVDVHGGFTSWVEGFARLVTHITDVVPATDIREKRLEPVGSLEELRALGG